jgi:putative sterol carrier protein
MIFPTADWLQGTVSAWADVSGTPGFDFRVQWVIPKAPEGEGAYTLTFADGRVTAAALGTDPGADITLTLPYDQARDIQRGQADPSVLYMQGQLKTAGDNRTVLRYLELLASAPGAAAQHAIAALTE